MLSIITFIVLIILILSLALMVMKDRGFTGFKIPKFMNIILGGAVLVYLILTMILVCRSAWQEWMNL